MNPKKEQALLCTLKKTLFVAGVLTFFSAVTLNTKVMQAQTIKSECVSVDSRQGWQRFNLPGSYSRVTSISGGWSVDTRNYAPVDTEGHIGQDAERLAPYNQYKFDLRFPFGALLMRTGAGILWVQSPISFTNRFVSVDMRINDADDALGDNGGTLQVCFGN